MNILVTNRSTELKFCILSMFTVLNYNNILTINMEISIFNKTQSYTLFSKTMIYCKQIHVVLVISDWLTQTGIK